jgi:hypothetical protein
MSSLYIYKYMNLNNLWEEKNSIEQRKKSKNNLIFDQNDITNEIKKNATENEWKDIGYKNTNQKRCPKCNVNQVYKSLKLLNRAIKKNVFCKKCVLKGRILSPMTYEQKIKLSVIHKKNGTGKWMNGRTLTDKTKEKISNSHKGKKLTTETKLKQSLSKLGDLNPAKRLDVRQKISDYQRKNKRTISEETRRKLSIKSKESILKRIEKFGKICPNFNPNACNFFNKLNEQNNWNLQHALNGGEKRVLCYFLDAYDVERNIVVEYDEPHHYDIKGNLKNKDYKRMIEIFNHLKCKFYRYNEVTNQLTEVNLDLLNDGDMNYV